MTPSRLPCLCSTRPGRRRDSVAALSARHRLIRYDERGCGLSDWQVPELSFDCWLGDFEAVPLTRPYLDGVAFSDLRQLELALTPHGALRAALAATN